MTPPGSITAPYAKKTPGAPTKPQARRPKASATKPAVTNPRRSVRIARLNSPPAEEEVRASSPVEEEPTAGETLNCIDLVAGSESESDEWEEGERSESDLSELSDGMFEQEIQARIWEVEKPLKDQLVVARAGLAVKTAERNVTLARIRELEAKLAVVTMERDEALARLR